MSPRRELACFVVGAAAGDVDDVEDDDANGSDDDDDDDNDADGGRGGRAPRVLGAQCTLGRAFPTAAVEAAVDVDSEGGDDGEDEDEDVDEEGMSRRGHAFKNIVISSVCGDVSNLAVVNNIL